MESSQTALATVTVQASLSTLSLDIFLIILRDLEIEDVLSVGQCSNHCASLASARPVWHILIHKLIASHHPIPPSPPLSTLSALDLKRTTLRARALHRAWTHAHPTRTRHVTTMPSRVLARLRPTSLSFVPGRGHRYVVGAFASSESADDPDDAKHLLRCVDFGESGKPGTDEPPSVIAWKRFTQPPIFVVNEVKDARAMIAVASLDPDAPGSTIHILDLDESSLGIQRLFTPSGTVSFGFTTVNRLNTEGIPLLLRDHTLVAGDAKGDLRLYNTDTGSISYELHNPGAASAMDATHIVLLSDMVLAFDNASIRQYALPRPPTPDAALPHPVLEPLSMHTWRWRIDTLSVSPLLHAHAPRTRPVINIWVRFGSWYPWPINMMHHYVLAPSTDTCSSSRTYAFPPMLTLYTYSALDLFAVSDSVVGPYGTAIWTDSQADTDGHGPGGSDGAGRLAGQRVAAKTLRPLPELAPVPGTVEDVGAGLGVDAGSITAGERYDRGITTVLGLLSRSQETCRLAMDEETGRVALAFQGGEMQLWDYMPEAVRCEAAA